MLSLRRAGAASTWQTAATSTIRAEPGRLARLRVPVLVAAAALFGAALASAIFVGVWKRADSHTQSAQAALTSASNQAARLRVANTSLLRDNVSIRRDVVTGRLRLARIRAVEARVQTANELLVRQMRSMGENAGAFERDAGSIGSGAASLSSLTSKFGSVLMNLEGYLSSTGAASLDPAFVKAQLVYLKTRVDQIAATASSLAGQAQSYADGARAFGFRAAANAAAAAVR